MQKFWSLLFGLVMTAAVLLFVVAPFLGWWLPRNVSSFGQKVDALLQAVDVNWKQDMRQIAGTVQVQAEWIWSSVDRATYDPNGALESFWPTS